MRHSSALFATVAAAVISLAFAQNSSSSFTGYSWQNVQYPYTLTTAQAAAVDTTTKQSWCKPQTDTCYQLCNNQYMVNSCIVSPLNGTVLWACQCQGFQTPNITQYGQTVVAFECNKYRDLCVQANTNNGTASKACADIQCPSGDAAAAQSSVASSLAAARATTMATSSTGAPATTTGATNTAAATSTGAAYAMRDVAYVGSGAIAAGVVGILGVAL